MIEAYDPDIVLLQIGTNDLLDNQNAGITDRLEKLVDKLLDSIDSDSMLFVASVPDIDVSVKHDWLWAYQSSGYSYENNPEEFTALVEQSVDNYNASVKELVEKKQAVGARIRFADINSVVDMKTGLEDGVHPNEAGYACMGKILVGAGICLPERYNTHTDTCNNDRSDYRYRSHHNNCN